MGRRALVVGIDHYQSLGSLHACVADAEAIARKLSFHKDGRSNFDCALWAGRCEDGGLITRAKLRAGIYRLFDYDGDVLFYFSGHGFLSKTGGLLCASDATSDDWGVPMQEVVDLAQQSRAREILMILDCCHGGALGNVGIPSSVGRDPIAALRENMTVLAASRSSEASMEGGGHGLFSCALLDALDGGAADHTGIVSAPALYSYVRRRFSAWDQCPVFKTHTTEVLVVRECEPLIDRLKLRRLAEHFVTSDSRYRLDPDYEPEDEDGNVKRPVNQRKVEIAQLFKLFRNAGLLRASDPGQELYWVARRSGTVELTERGKEYWWLVANGKL